MDTTKTMFNSLIAFSVLLGISATALQEQQLQLFAQLEACALLDAQPTLVWSAVLGIGSPKLDALFALLVRLACIATNSG